ncbi:hypothetical protein [Candidatus Odyssella thessalonicensis]|uniref:hypothetical protein n=1 Tax=Candidatus Odyssella thessalonicensis TaxID=84647 RepID=UPI000225B18C|nr:hypothetical protein [Candidatus Odyssella thessalonicensis]
MKTINLLLFLFNLLASAQDNLYLVVGSDRMAGEINNPYLSAIHQSAMADFSHQETFNRKATTLDLKSTRPAAGHHISNQDASSFIPSQPLQSLFMELFPSRGVKTYLDLERLVFSQYPERLETMLSSVRADLMEKISNPKEIEERLQRLRVMASQTPNLYNSLLAETISHLSKYMPSGATLDIEHIPLVTLRGFELSPAIASLMTLKNPFHLWVLPTFPYLLAAAMPSCPNEDEGWQDLVEMLQQQAPVSNRQALLLEAQQKKDLCRQAILNVEQLCQETEVRVPFEEEDFYSQLIADVQEQKENSPIKYALFSRSLASVIAIELNRLELSQPTQSHLYKFLMAHGFTAIQSLRDPYNCFNHRHNSWVISAIKK